MHNFKSFLHQTQNTRTLDLIVLFDVYLLHPKTLIL